jgi:outer membrane protein assembly factor BamE (lipoprotein component of BamABCDE complex)
MSRHLTCILAAVLLLGACAPTIETRGNMISDAKFKLVAAGTSNRADVEQQWGPPTNVSTLDPGTWYYIGETTAKEGVFEPKVTKRRMIQVKFDAQDKVVAVNDIDPKLARKIEPEDRVTPTAGKEYTMFQQFIGNLGKFNPNAGKAQGHGP